MVHNPFDQLIAHKRKDSIAKEYGPRIAIPVDTGSLAIVIAGVRRVGVKLTGRIEPACFTSQEGDRRT